MRSTCPRLVFFEYFYSVHCTLYEELEFTFIFLFCNKVTSLQHLLSQMEVKCFLQETFKIVLAAIKNN